jgi:hypothetical protein
MSDNEIKKTSTIYPIRVQLSFNSEHKELYNDILLVLKETCMTMPDFLRFASKLTINLKKQGKVNFMP